MAKPASLSPATDDKSHEKQEAAKIKLIHLSDESGTMKKEEITERPLKKDMLKTDDAYILYAGSAGVFAWVGRLATKDEKTAAMKHAQDFVKEENVSIIFYIKFYSL